MKHRINKKEQIIWIYGYMCISHYQEDSGRIVVPTMETQKGKGHRSCITGLFPTARMG